MSGVCCIGLSIRISRLSHIIVCLIVDTVVTVPINFLWHTLERLHTKIPNTLADSLQLIIVVDSIKAFSFL
jgi:hypothetical protein